MTNRLVAVWGSIGRNAIVVAAGLIWFCVSGREAEGQRLLGIDVSAYQGNLTSSNWTTLNTTNSRAFVFIRSSRGGTTGEDHRQGAYPSGNNTFFNASERYDDPYFVQNINRATAAGLFAGAYHFVRPDVFVGTVNSDGSTVTVANTGTDEADHFIQMAGPWMRPGYMPPMLDFEAGQAQRTADQMAQFVLDFSNRIYQVMGIRPSIYSNGSYAGTLQSASASLRNQIAQPSSNPPTVVSPALPTLVTARYPNGSGNQYTGNVQTEHPRDTVATVYGPWDDYGTTNPWTFWQYSSGERLSGYSLSSNIDADVAQGDIEFVKDQLIPAVWMNDSSGDWSSLANWNSGQTPTAPPQMAGQLTPIGTQTLPAARLPGAAGSGPTAGSNDTVILERSNANITVMLSTGTQNIRKLYMRETLNITGGSLTINYDPNYVSDTVNYPSALRSGLISAQFSGAVTLSGTGSLSVNTLQIDASKTFTLAGSTGALTFKQINLLSAAKIAVTGDVNINPLSNATATISGSSGNVDLSGGTWTFTVGNGSSDVDLDVGSPITNGGLTKNGAGTMRLSGSNTFAGAMTVNEGVLRSNNATGFSSSSVITVNGGTLDMNGITDTVASLGGSGGAVTQGAAALTLGAVSGTSAFGGAITGSGAFTKNGAATQILSGNNSLGPVTINAGSLLFNGTNTTGTVTVASGGTLGGTGSVSGAVIVNNGGHVAPGASVESLGVGALSLVTGSVLDIELNGTSTNDSINVAGLLTLNGGSVNLTNLGSWDVGNFNLINYGSINLMNNLSARTGGPSNFNYSFVNTGSAIQLSVTLPGDFNLDSKVDAADYLLWRKSDGTQSNFDLWRTNFGRSAGDGSGAGLSGSTSIPEPATAWLVVWLALPFVNRRFRRRG